MKANRLKQSGGIRPATRADARDLAFLINEAGEGLPLYFWSRNEAGVDPWEQGRQRAARDEGDFSWRNAHVVERDGKIVAMLLGFVIQQQKLDLDEVPEIVRPLVHLEQQATGSWYINAIATQSEWRGQGIGTELLALAHACALRAGCRRVSLQNFTSNREARRLYQRTGFQEVMREPMPKTPGLPDFGESILHVMSVDTARAARFLPSELQPAVAT